MTLTELAWLSLAAYAIHMVEEFMLDWRDWARAVIKLPVDWGDFYITNSVVVVLGIVQAQLAATFPLAPLVFAALMLVNATFFHVAPVIWTRGRFSPGAITAVLLFYPMAYGVYARAAADGVLTDGLLAGSLVLGAVLMALPIAFLHLRGLPYFRQTP
ncbi:HXXEE domain-containing protein [Xanthobacter pseudotagetidis]|uniref:HXXEE domain-containing protein n=1 Tax=Xanthobacter pseudotagetidis TaxID=3119911 RepID=UPI00372CA103